MRTEGKRGVSLAVAALGVVFGDIGTSPLYTVSTAFAWSGAAPGNAADVLGICSLLIWTLVYVVCIKYVGFLMRVDHDGEGGILALLALAKPNEGRVPATGGWIALVVIAGAAMLFGDGMITPAISVISAVEGVEIVNPAAAHAVVPAACLILLALFALQSRGTEKVGRVFGPVMGLWFAAIGVAGGAAVIAHPAALAALSPLPGVLFLVHHGPHSLVVFGGVVLAVTGVEALYADMSHFGRKPIVWGWYGAVFPALVLCYLGQAAVLLGGAKTVTQSFYALTPGPWLVPMIALATAATVIASQALISGAFTLVKQSIALGLWPRLTVRHTSARIAGQVFVPAVNMLLAVGCIGLVLAFRSSERLAGAYGLAVSCTMLATTLVYADVLIRRRGWRVPAAVALTGAFGIVEASFIIASLPKILDGGWFPFTIAAVLGTLSWIWLRGRVRLRKCLIANEVPADRVSAQLAPIASEASTMVVLSPDIDVVPLFGDHPWLRRRAREERLVVITFEPIAVPRMVDAERVIIDRVGELIRVRARFGYMEPPRMTPVFEATKRLGLHLDREDTSFFYADPKVERADEHPMYAWQRNLFTMMQRLAIPLPDELGIPAERRIEVGFAVSV